METDLTWKFFLDIEAPPEGRFTMLGENMDFFVLWVGFSINLSIV